MHWSRIPLLATSLMVTSCGGGGEAAPGTDLLLSYVPPVAGTTATYAIQVTDNSNNSISSSQQYSYTSVGQDGSYTLRRDDLTGRTVVNGSPYGGYSFSETFNASGNLATRALLAGSAPYTCSFSPAESPIPLPLAINSTWNTFSAATCTDGRTLNYRFSNGRVIGTESVSVPAGVFQAVHVHYTVSISSNSNAYTQQIEIDAWIDILSGRYAKIQDVFTFVGGTPTSGYPVSQSLQLASLHIGA